MPRWVLPVLILIGLYVLSVNPLVAYFSRGSGGQIMVPTWLRSYGSPYLWAYENSPKPLQNISDSYFQWCRGYLAQAEEDIKDMGRSSSGGIPLKPPPILPIAP